ncbi:hypothetical protein T472_0203040 [Youngiibacter fragilis 232.1]|uniref:Uncharacterized protein n=1 Tax=Youngiibacter fragilis 232.1 TaxID=994573 RepID=V7IAR4_9CLOT|nr:hypothetical protein T472_0203040 [Youngiibacter fragilis 232.1]
MRKGIRNLCMIPGVFSFLPAIDKKYELITGIVYKFDINSKPINTVLLSFDIVIFYMAFLR